MGAIITCLTASVDPRPKAVATIVGGADLEKLFAESNIGVIQALRTLTNGHYELINMLMYMMDPQHVAFLTKGKAFQLHNGLQDISVPTGYELFLALPEPKEQYWYEGTHLTTFLHVGTIFPRMFEWFEKY